jgi:hypothetical protein
MNFPKIIFLDLRFAETKSTYSPEKASKAPEMESTYSPDKASRAPAIESTYSPEKARRAPAERGKWMNYFSLCFHVCFQEC